MLSTFTMCNHASPIFSLCCRAQILQQLNSKSLYCLPLLDELRETCGRKKMRSTLLALVCANVLLIFLCNVLFIQPAEGLELVINDNVTTLTELANDYLDETETDGATFDFINKGTVLPIGSFQPHSASSPSLRAKRAAIRDAVAYAWGAYSKYAWGQDELMPISKRGKNTFGAGLGVTIIDSLSTLYMIKGLEEEYKAGREWVANSFDLSNITSEVSVFETVIRILGGLMSIFQLSGDAMYLKRAEELGARLAPCFDTRFGLPRPRCVLGNVEKQGRIDLLPSDNLFLAEIGTVQLEFGALAYHSKQPLLKVMGNITRNIVQHIEGARPLQSKFLGPNKALVPFTLSLSSGMWTSGKVTLGAPADSYFEYLVKQWVQSGRKETMYWNRFAKVMDGICDTLCYTTRNGDTIVREMMTLFKGNSHFTKRMDHFSCYIPGMIILGLDGLDKSEGDRRVKWEWVAEQLTETCFKMYQRSPSGLSGEAIQLRRGDDGKWLMSGGYELRPEAVEAFFYMFRHTKKEKYRWYAWHVFERIEEHCRVENGGGYSAIQSAQSKRPTKSDIMHSFLIAETFKYLYLIFGDDPDELPLDKWVFNTEAHPLLVTPGMADERG